MEGLKLYFNYEKNIMSRTTVSINMQRLSIEITMINKKLLQLKIFVNRGKLDERIFICGRMLRG